MKFEGTMHASRCDASTSLLLLFAVLVCIWPLLLDGDWVGTVIVALVWLCCSLACF